MFWGKLMNNHLALKISTIALSIMLASCGGGGGYYKEESNENIDIEEPIENSEQVVNSLKIELSKLSLAASNDSLVVTVRALDANKGGLEEVDISLSIIDSTNNVLINGKSVVSSDENGNAIFIINTPTTSSNITELINKGFTVKASANAGKLSQEQTITVNGNKDTITDTTSIVLFETTKSTLNVRGDQTALILTAVDDNGAVLPNQAISLKIKDVALNGVQYVAEASQTDSNGQIRYTLKMSESARSVNYSAEKFISDGLNLEANFGQSTTIYKYKLNIINSDVPKPVGAITVAYNPTTIADSANGVYYYKNISVQVNDIDGKPLPYRDVRMGVNSLLYVKGGYSFDEVDGTVKYVYHPTAGCNSNNSLSEIVNLDGQEITQLKPLNGQTVQVVSYINREGQPATDNKYTTDGNGRFDLQIQYPKIFASWLNIQLTAKSLVSDNLIVGTTSLGLSYLSTDVDITSKNGPNMISPFGTSSSCNDAN